MDNCAIASLKKIPIPNQFIHRPCPVYAFFDWIHFLFLFFLKVISSQQQGCCDRILITASGLSLASSIHLASSIAIPHTHTSFTNWTEILISRKSYAL